jgi:hypothetical protein
MELTFKNNLHATHAVALDEICPTDSDDYEKKIESMAEDLVGRMTRLHKRLGVLRVSGISKKEKEKIRTWTDKKSDELHQLTEIIRKRKRPYVKTISTHDLIRLANHHPVWKTHYDLYMDQIEKTDLTHEGENAIVQCTIKQHVLNSLIIFHHAGEGSVLCINSDRGLRYEDGGSGQSDGIRWRVINDVSISLRRNMFRMVERIRAQWVSTGDKWGLNDNVLWLDFGGGKERATHN